MDFASLWESRHSTLELLAELEKDADTFRDIELSSCVTVQKMWRGHRAWAKLVVKRRECVRIQRMERGMQCRAVVKEMFETRRETESKAILQYYSTLLQKSFRGAYSRKYKHDFAARKAYLASVVSRGEELRREGEARRAKEREEEEARRQEERRKEFEKLTKNRHHLVSTKSIPGVYEGHTVKGVRVESYLCSVKDLLRRPRLRKNLDGVRKLQPPFEPDRRSIQASTPYEEASISKNFVERGNFRCGQRVHLAPYQRGVNGASEFFDPWRNPSLKRGSEESGKTKRVFCTSVGGNKSYVRPNGLFDEILRAEHHGGVTRRQLAVSQGRITKKGDFAGSLNPRPPAAEDSCLLRGSSLCSGISLINS